MQINDIIMAHIDNEPCCMTNSHQHLFEYREDENIFWCRMCGYWIGKDDPNFLYLKTKQDELLRNKK